MLEIDFGDVEMKYRYYLKFFEDLYIICSYTWGYQVN